MQQNGIAWNVLLKSNVSYYLANQCFGPDVETYLYSLWKVLKMQCAATGTLCKSALNITGMML